MLLCVQVHMISGRFTTSSHKRFAKNATRDTQMTTNKWKAYNKNVPDVYQKYEIRNTPLLRCNEMLIIYRQLAHHTFAMDANTLFFEKKQTIRDRNKAQEKPLKRAPGRPGPENAIWTTAALTENDKFPAANFLSEILCSAVPSPARNSLVARLVRIPLVLDTMHDSVHRDKCARCMQKVRNLQYKHASLCPSAHD